MKGSVPNIKRAMREGNAAPAGRAKKLQQQRAGSSGSRLNDRTAKAFRGPQRGNSQLATYARRTEDAA